ncbi:MAG TPA: hypothetical protein VII94_00245, partial [Candidatus Saccharimonadales bacterium]
GTSTMTKDKLQESLDDIKAKAPLYQCMDCWNHEYNKRLKDYKVDKYMQEMVWDLIEKYNTKEVCGHFNPEYWVEKDGYVINWGDADLGGHEPNIKIHMLKKMDEDGKHAQYMLLIPKYLRRPAHYSNGHGDY